MNTYVNHSALAAFGLVLLCAVGGTGCSSDDPSDPAPPPAPVAPPSPPPARTFVENADLALRADNLFADPQFDAPGYRFNSFFAVDPVALTLTKMTRLAIWDSPFGRRSPALSVNAKVDTSLGAFFAIPDKGGYRVSLWLSAEDAVSAEPVAVPESVKAHLLLATGKTEVAALTPQSTRVVGARTWVQVAATVMANAGTYFLYVGIPKGVSVLIAAPEAVASTAKMEAPSPSGVAPEWVRTMAGRLPESPLPPRLVPPRPR
jgi:hypothetical protein